MTRCIRVAGNLQEIALKLNEKNYVKYLDIGLLDNNRLWMVVLTLVGAGGMR
jgi:hypothetical protein